MNPLTYIAAPLAGPDRDVNIARALRWVAWAAQQPGVVPVATWISLTQVWHETPENRTRGLALDCSLIERCGRLWLVGGRISAGMAIEAEHARSCGIDVRDLTGLGLEPPEGT
jgi:hypothetical protein